METWSQYRQQARLFYVLTLSYFIAISCGTCCVFIVFILLSERWRLDPGDTFVYGVGIILVYVASLVAIFQLLLKILVRGGHPAMTFRCPRCQRLFFVPNWLRRLPWRLLIPGRCYVPILLLLVRQCVHCGLPKWEESRNSDTRAQNPTPRL
jgi:hypothetical protein